MLIAAGGKLAQMANHIKPSTKQVPAHTYDNYLKVLSTLLPRSLLFAAAALGHPHPDPQPFVQYAPFLSPEKVQAWTQHKRSVLLIHGCDAIRILIEQNKIREATELGQHIQHLLPESTQATSTATQEPRSDENLLLHRLNLNFNLT